MSTLKVISLQHPSAASPGVTINTSNVEISGITATSMPSGSWVLLNTLTASSSATLSDITNITSTYRTFILLIEGLVPVTNATGLYMQIYSGGAYQTSSYAYSQIIASNYATQTAQAFIKLSWQNNQVSNVAANGGYNGMVILQNPSQTSFYKQILAHGCNWDTSFAGPLITNVAGTWNGGTGAITGFQLYMSSGNISTGNVRIYGVRT